MVSSSHLTKNLLPQNQDGCPYLLLAPMEGVGDRPFRRAMASIGGFDEACTEFMRVPLNAHISSLVKSYRADELAPIPQAAQIMGPDPQLMAEMTSALAEKGALRVDLNCGCPSNTVTGKGAGSSLLKEPNQLYTLAKAMVEAVDIPVTVKLRSGFEDTSLFEDNVLAAQASGAAFITLHPRTKVEGYIPPANWSLIAKAKRLLSIPLVGNGDILTVQDALNMREMTHCDALMIGRGAVINPFIFHEIKAYYSKKPFIRKWSQLVHFLTTFQKELSSEMTLKGQVSKLKQIMSFLFKGSANLLDLRPQVLRFQSETPQAFLDFALSLYQKEWREEN